MKVDRTTTEKKLQYATIYIYTDAHIFTIAIAICLTSSAFNFIFPIHQLDIYEVSNGTNAYMYNVSRLVNIVQ